MAKVTGPLHSSEARGAVGSLTYNSWRGLSTVKARSGPLVTMSDDQRALRALTAACTVLWQAATQATRDGWNIYALNHPDTDWTGLDKRLSGYNWFIRINVRRQLVGQAILSTPPATSVTIRLLNYQLYGAGTDLWTTWDVADPPMGEVYFVEAYLTAALSAGRFASIKEAQRHGYRTFETGGDGYESMAAGSYTIFGRIVRDNGTVGTFVRSSVSIP